MGQVGRVADSPHAAPMGPRAPAGLAAEPAKPSGARRQGNPSRAMIPTVFAKKLQSDLSRSARHNCPPQAH
jgi:hypothetical protein